MRRVRHTTGSVLFDKGRGTWRFLQWVDGKRRSQTLGTKQELPNQSSSVEDSKHANAEET